MVEEQLMECRTPDRASRLAAGPLVLSRELQQDDRRELDDAVLELIGVAEPNERLALIQQLHEATASHFRDIRVVEIEKMKQRAKAGGSGFTLRDLAADIWDAAELEDATPLSDWLGAQPESDSLAILLDERPAALSDDTMFSPDTVYFGRKKKSHMDCRSRGQAELVVRLANLGLVGEVKVPADFGPCLKVLDRVNRRLELARVHFKELAESRTSDERIQGQLLELLTRWFVVLSANAQNRARTIQRRIRKNERSRQSDRVSFLLPESRRSSPLRKVSDVVPADVRDGLYARGVGGQVRQGVESPRSRQADLALRVVPAG